VTEEEEGQERRGGVNEEGRGEGGDGEEEEEEDNDGEAYSMPSLSDVNATNCHHFIFFRHQRTVDRRLS